MLKNILFAAVSVLMAQTAGAIGAAYTSASIPVWYAGLIKPSFSPPNWLFAPVWITLFVLMGIAAYLVWRKEELGRKDALETYLASLILNAWWSLIFFGMHEINLAFFEILILWVVILLTAMKFYRIDKAAGILFIPYILWVFFAAILNLKIALLN